MDPAAVARGYYDAIDDGEYDRLRELLAVEFVHDRPDRVIDGRDAFVSFMGDDRPRTDTSHVIEELYVAADRVAVEGHLVADDGDRLFRFVDTFAFDGDRIRTIRTYTG